MRIFDALYYYQGDKNTVDVILSTSPGMKPGSVLPGAQWLQLSESYVHPDDRKQFMQFIRPEISRKWRPIPSIACRLPISASKTAVANTAGKK